MTTFSTPPFSTSARRAPRFARPLLAFATLTLLPACVLDWTVPEGAGGGGETSSSPSSTTSSSSSGGSCPSSVLCGVLDDCSPYVCDAACCQVTCQGGSCAVQCGDASECYVACAGSNCEVDCGTAAICKLGCAGGNCTVHGANADEVELGCDGIAAGTLQCENAQTCTVASSSASCSCEGGGCS